MRWKDNAQNLTLPKWYRREFWDKSKAIEEQNSIAHRVRFTPLSTLPKIVAAFDVSFKDDHMRAAGVVYDIVLKKILEVHTLKQPSAETIPYIPTFLSYREIPVLIELIKHFSIEWSVALIDGQGIMHPRQCGLATHIGVLLDMPTIGCAKSPLFGDFHLPEEQKFQASPVYNNKNEIIGYALRTRENTKPIFVSPGNLITLDQSLEIVKMCTGKYRIPEPLRAAHIFSKKA